LALGTTLVGNPVLPLVTADLIPPGNPEPGTLAGGGKPADAPFSTLDLAVGLDREVVATFPPFDSSQSYSAEAIIFSEIQNIKKYADTQVLNIGRKKRSPLFGSWLTGKRRRGKGRGRGKPRARAPRQRVPRPRAPRRPLQTRPRGPKRLQPKKRQPKRFPFHRQQQRRPSRPRGPPRRNFLPPKGPNKLVKGFQCLRTKLYAQYHSDIIEELRYITQVPYENKPPSYNLGAHDVVINSLDDCIGGIEEPLYGFRVRVKLVEDEPCILGDTCKDGLMETLDNGAEPKSSESYFSESPPTCHSRFDPYLSGC